MVIASIGKESPLIRYSLIVEMDKGRTVEQGSHESLLKVRGKDFELYMPQFAGLTIRKSSMWLLCVAEKGGFLYNRRDKSICSWPAKGLISLAESERGKADEEGNRHGNSGL